MLPGIFSEYSRKDKKSFHRNAAQVPLLIRPKSVLKNGRKKN